MIETKIKSKKQHEAIMFRIEELIVLTADNKPHNEIHEEELTLLGELVSEYEAAHYAVVAPTIGELIYYKMEELNMTQAAVAEKLGISSSRVSEYVNGKAEPTFQVAKSMYSQLGIDPYLILGI